jgi:hypothetical protein
VQKLADVLHMHIYFKLSKISTKRRHAALCSIVSVSLVEGMLRLINYTVGVETEVHLHVNLLGQ